MDDFFDFDNDTTENQDGSENLFGDLNTESLQAEGFGGNSGNNSGNNDDTNTKKVLIISIVVGIVGVCLAFFLWSHLRAGRSDGADIVDTTGQNVVSSTETPADNSVDERGSNNTVQQSIQNKDINSGNTEVSVTSGFVVVDSSTMPYVSEPIDGCFTVIDIKTFAKKKDDKYGNYFKSIIYGNLTGLEGVYELTVPFESISKVHIGDVLDVKYTTVTVGDEKYVVDIR